jgi:hypothetical protein
LLFAAMVFAAATAAAPSEVHAQWGWGYGGFGMGGQIGNYAIVSNINARSSAAAGHAYAIRQSLPGSGNVYAGNPNSFVNRVRDTSFSERFDVSTRRRIESEVARNPEVAATAAGVPPRTRPRTPPILPLANFFSAAGQLIWPTSSPIEGPLGSQRAAADASARAVYKEFQARGTAPVGLVTDARLQLVEYGRPAMEFLQKNSSAEVAQAFHTFLLGLYDSLGAVAMGNVSR